MEKNSKETPDKIARKKGFHRVIEKIRNLPKRDEAGPSNSNTQQPQIEEKLKYNNTPERRNRDRSSDSDQTIAVPAFNFKRHFGDTSVRCIQMEQQTKYSKKTNGN